MIKDSGNRTEFETGAVRDIQEGKGRCDLLPLDVVAECYKTLLPDRFANVTLDELSAFVDSGDVCHLYNALGVAEPYDAFSTMFLEVAIHMEEGAKKYGERNWQRGIPVQRYIDSGVRHYLKWLRGDNDEPHDRAFCWNIMCAIWTCKHKPELNEYMREENAADRPGKHLTAVDAVEVVRCKDCIHYGMGVCLKIYSDGAASVPTENGGKKMRLIDADELIAKMRRQPMFERTDFDKKMIYVEKSVIDQMPTIDPDTLRPKGRWEALRYNDGFIYALRCSECRSLGCEFTPHCPNCGAKMEV